MSQFLQRFGILSRQGGRDVIVLLLQVPQVNHFNNSISYCSVFAMDCLHRLIVTVASRFTNRRFVFAIGAVAVIASKIVHIYVHLAALSTVDVVCWGPSFFAQDVVFLLLLRLILDRQLFSKTKLLHLLHQPWVSSSLVAH